MSKTRFAVYGTLKKGHGNNRCLGDATYLGTHKTEPNYTLYDGGFPVVERDGDTGIHVEVFETDNPRIISDVNALEGCTGIKGHEDNWYDFDIIDTPFGKANMFVMNKGTSGRTHKINSGTWR